MLREVKNAGFVREGVVFKRHRLVVGKKATSCVLRPPAYTEFAGRQAVFPQALQPYDGRQYWAYAGRFYWEDQGLSAHDVQALVHERETRQQRKLERAHATMRSEASPRRRDPIPRDVRLTVFTRDEGRCVECASSFDIQYDHVIPVALGGATSVENLQILCADCNRRKGATLG
jgi:5-methylcytosine-specific restriction endonuclease McrA